MGAYQLKDVAQILYDKWESSRTIGSVPIVWETFKFGFLERFFHREFREDKL